VCFFLLFFLLPESFWDRTPQSANPGAIELRPTSVMVVDNKNDEGFPTGVMYETAGDFSNNKPNNKVNIAITSTSVTSLSTPSSGTTSHPSGLSTPPSKTKQSPPDSFDAAKGEVIQLENVSLSAASGAHKFSYTEFWRLAPRKTYIQSLKPFPGRLSNGNWHLAAIRPFILFAYPSILWSALVYSMCIGWLVVLSESVSTVYRDRYTYNFTSFQVGLVYLSPFIGSVLGTALTGMLSDFIVKFMARRNGGVFEPEFRLVMALPVAISSVIGLMGFGWSVDVHDNYIVPTVFFGVISFGCSLGSSTAITFCVDSYRQYAGEALVTLNFSKSEFYISTQKLQI
jgi:hypothetical protein